jgi:hypothetical protein
MRNVLHQIYINLWVEYGRPQAVPEQTPGGTELTMLDCSCQEPPFTSRTQERRRSTKRALRAWTGSVCAWPDVMAGR